jgi:hypothetical protein
MEGKAGMRLWYCLTTLVFSLVTLFLVYLNIVLRIVWQDDHGPNSAPSLEPTIGLGAIGIVLFLLSVMGAALSVAERARETSTTGRQRT